MTIGQLLREAREKAKLNQSDAADATGISQGNISEYERDNGNPTIVTLRKLCECYGTTVSKLTRQLD
jgi:transcriptional regulator with XRE-family HTH domain